MDIKVIVATHKQYRMPSDNCYMPAACGKTRESGSGLSWR